MMPSISKICALLCPKNPKSFQIPSQTLPKPSPNLPKATQNPSKRPLGAHLEPMLSKNVIWNAQKTVKMRPKVGNRRPRASQTPPKLSPRLSKIRFSSNFFVCFFLIVNLHRFLQFCGKFCTFFKEPTFKIHAPTQCFVDLHSVLLFSKKTSKIA